MSQKPDLVTEEIQENAMATIRELLQNEDIARFAQELEDQNRF
ncbi:hypothetical protein [Metabacillus sp. SLBN-84]